MGRTAGDRITPETGQELCLRTGSKAMLTGSVASLGSQYVIGLRAVNCSTGDVIAEAQQQAASKEKVIAALGEASATLRRELGESISTLQQYDVPLEQATTPSLEALKAYSLGFVQASRGNLLESIPLYKRAIELDPNFATAYAHMGQAYANSSQIELAVASVKQAYERRERASEAEKLYITTRFYELVTKDVDKRIEALQTWTRMYPRNGTSHNDLASEYVDMGRFDQGLAEAQETVRLSPSHYTGYELLGWSYLGLNRFADVRAIREKQVAEGSAGHWDHIDLYLIAFFENDAAGMQREVEWAKGKTYEFFMQETIAGVQASAGKLKAASQIYLEASESARQAKFNDIAANMIVDRALMEAVATDGPGAAQKSQAESFPLEGEHGRRHAGITYGIRGDVRRASEIADQLSKDAPTATYVNRVWVPVIRAEVEIDRGNPTKAVELLRASSPYEFGWKAGLWPSYVRGRAYLKAHQGKEAAAEFEHILDHRGSCAADALAPLLYALSHLQLARARVLSGDASEARKSYQDFFALWKDADSDALLLKTAKAEYASLH
jgi:tetratricopeptide (TPR) repeat protein